MIEYRSDFLQDAHKQGLFEAIVKIHLELGQPATALEYVERAKSAALLDLLTYRFDLRIHSQAKADQSLVDQLNQSLKQRNRLFRRYQPDPDQNFELKDIAERKEQLVLEEQITKLWQRLLVRNDDYAREPMAAPIDIDVCLQYLDTDTLLIEYFAIDDQLWAFMVSGKDPKNIAVQSLSGTLSEVKNLWQVFQLNLNTVPKIAANQVEYLITNAQATLNQLWEILLKPIHSVLKQHHKLVIIPYGALHYLSFAALYNGGYPFSEIP